MKNTKLILFACLWLFTTLVAVAHPTMAGRLKSYANGVLVIEQEDKSLKKFLISDKTSVNYMGRNSSLAALPVGAKISIEVIGSLGANPLKAGKIVDWGSSEQIVAVGAKAPYYTAVGQYASTSGSGGVPDGAPVGNHAASHTLGTVAIGGSINAPTQENTPTGSTPGPNPNSFSTSNQVQSTQYVNQGTSLTAPLEMQGINPYGSEMDPSVRGAYPSQGGQGSNPAVNPGQNPSMGGVGANPGMDPSLGMQPANGANMDPSMMGMDPTIGMNNPYAQSNLGTGQSASLMGLTGDDEDGEYSASGDMMGLGGVAGGSGDKLTGSVLQVDMQRGLLMIQSFTSSQPQRVLMGAGASCPPDLLIPGKMVEITGHPTNNGFQATDIRAAAGY